MAGAAELEYKVQGERGAQLLPSLSLEAVLFSPPSALPSPKSRAAPLGWQRGAVGKGGQFKPKRGKAAAAAREEPVWVERSEAAFH